MRAEGLEPPSPKAYGPKPYASANSATPANGTPTRARTWDTLIKSQVLCQLSYEGARKCEIPIELSVFLQH